MTGDAAAATVAVLFDVTQAREYVLSDSFQYPYTGFSVPLIKSIRMFSFSGSSAPAAAEAFEAARRAIIRCGEDGYLLPIEKYLPWNVVEATFGPEGVRVR